MRYLPALLLITAANATAQQFRTVSARVGGHHVEPHLAGNPRDPNELVVAGMLVGDIDPASWRLRAFWSDDGGEHWRQATLPFKDGSACSADAWLAWGRGRNVYLTCLAAVSSGRGSDFSFRIWLHASTDAGRTWKPPIELVTQPLGEWDHPVLSLAPARADKSLDTLFVVGTRPRHDGNGFGVARYSESESRFDTIRLYEPPEHRNDSFGSAVAIDPERVVFTYFAMVNEPPRPLFSVSVKDTTMHRTRVTDDEMPYGFPMLTRTTNATHAHLLATWLESDSRQNLSVVLGASLDTGRTWSSTAVSEDAAIRFRARPNVIVDSRGSVAVTWFEANSIVPCGDIVLAVRGPGTGSFSEAARVPTTQAACDPALDSHLATIVNRWRAGGGDYTGIHSPAAGIFDIVWSDVRQDGFQIRFLRTHVRR